MKQSTARTLIAVSLVLSMISFVLSLIALYLPHWKYIHFRSTLSPIIPTDNNHMDPLIRGEIERYADVLFPRDQKHSYGLSSHCIVGEKCGQNLLPSFSDTEYTACHGIKHHEQCIFSSHSNFSSNKCICQRPLYTNTIRTFLILAIAFEILLFLGNFLRLHRYIPFLNDLQLRIVAIVSALFSFLSLLIIIIQHKTYESYETLVYFETMRGYYSRRQIYPFAHDLEVIINRITSNLDIQSGSSFICMIVVFVLTIISFFTSSTVEVKVESSFDEDEKKDEQKASMERFIPYEQIRFPRQTKV
ncbi:unnamed protein product [Adineta ricciae]|uniref:Uncharacterized protein n=1 Tax=Adineta ricciae TaxID=249248 RepID=A0A814GI87_ADIRI|nr:unnamed protein product [Adineta ricciae]